MKANVFFNISLNIFNHVYEFHDNKIFLIHNLILIDMCDSSKNTNFSYNVIVFTKIGL